MTHDPEPSLDQRRSDFLTEHVYAALVVVFVVWSLLISYAYFWNGSYLRKEKVTLATDEARSLWNKDQAFRQWATTHGGVYVPPDERTPPNPHLAHVPDRDIVSTDGRRLTLMNPAYMMRQMTQEFERSYGIKGKITGLRFLNPVNAPDPWERAVLERFLAGDAGEVVEEAQIDGRPFLRYMKPMYMTKGCEKCHAILGFKDGDLRGGVSVSVPLTPYFAAASASKRSMLLTYASVWLIGGIGLLLYGMQASRKTNERNRLLARLEQAALYDRLTGLPTRLLIEDRIAHALSATERRAAAEIAVCFIDLDRFKQVNDAYGHAVGDQLLVAIGEALQDAIRPSDTVARLGGDEYVVLLNGVQDAREAVRIASRLLAALQAPIDLAGRTLHVDASIGIAVSETGDESPEVLIRHADIAMYRAKHGDQARIEVFYQDMHELLRERSELEQALRDAVTGEQLEVHYQPIVSAGQARVIGFEALLRWRHPERGYISPELFVPIAENIGLIQQIGDWVLAQACQALGNWQRLTEAMAPPLFVSVNLSARQLLGSDLVATVRQMVESGQISARQLCLEVTETALISEQERVRASLAGLRELGCRLSVDDFGTGYSSLTYLQRYSFDSIKIDRQFVQDDSTTGAGSKLCRALIGLAKDLGMSVIAEGVETQEQRLRLQAMGGDQMQGFYFSRPLPPAQVDALCERGALDRLAESAAA